MQGSIERCGTYRDSNTAVQQREMGEMVAAVVRSNPDVKSLELGKPSLIKLVREWILSWRSQSWTLTLPSLSSPIMLFGYTLHEATGRRRHELCD